jgi:hypothetical protein
MTKPNKNIDAESELYKLWQRLRAAWAKTNPVPDQSFETGGRNQQLTRPFAP